MTSILVVEDGTKPADANSYITVAFANSYHLLQGNDDWSGDDSELELAIVKATQAVELLYGPKYLSQRLIGNQSLLWPRFSFYDNHLNLIVQGTIPTALKNAVAEAALLALTGTEMFPDVNVAGLVKSESIKVGEIQTQVTYQRAPELVQFENFRKVELLLYPILFKQKKSVNLSR